MVNPLKFRSGQVILIELLKGMYIANISIILPPQSSHSTEGCKDNDIQLDLSTVWSGNQTQKLSIDLPKQIFTLEASQQSKLFLFWNYWIFRRFCVLLLINTKKWKQNFDLISFASHTILTHFISGESFCFISSNVQPYL